MEAFLRDKKTTLLAAGGVIAAVTAGFNEWFMLYPDAAIGAGIMWLAAEFAAMRAALAKVQKAMAPPADEVTK